MLTSDDLKALLHKRLSRLEKMLIVLATFDGPAQVKELQEAAADAGFREARKWNISDIFARSNGLAVRTKLGWELTPDGRQVITSLGIKKVSPAAAQVAADLRLHLNEIADDQTRRFVEEAISCHEAGLYRAAIIMSWVGAMNVLHRYVVRNKLAEFNEEAGRVHGKKWKAAVSQDDLGRLGERDFLERLEGISILGKNAKAQLIAALDLRNGCGHPNSLKVGVNKSAAHLETLLQNVFEVF
ncbi:hypothetical protein AAG594_05480 [Citromicrobium bathyomarinum]